MFFKKHTEHKKKRGGGILGIFRLFLSLIMISILGFGLLQAYRAFAGYDPLSIDPKSLVKNFATSEGALSFVTALLSAEPPKSVDDVKKLLSDTNTKVINQEPKSSAPLVYKFAVISDSHKDTESLRKALNQAKEEGVKFIIGIGDFSDVGTEEELRSTKNQFDAIGLPFYVTPGDHDLWDSRDKKHPAERNFTAVFGTPYQAFTYEPARFILVYNSDNYLGLDENQIKWVEEEVERNKNENPKVTFGFASTPFFHPSSDRVMGKENPKLKNQAEHLISIMSKGGIDEVFFADTHFSSRFTEPKTNLKMTTTGAVTSVRNPQSPRFITVDVHEDGSYNVREVEVR